MFYNNFNYSNNQQSFKSKIKYFYKQNKYLSYLISINFIVWLLVFITNLFVNTFNSNSPINAINKTNIFLKYFALSGNLNTFIKMPWTILTYMFVHERFLHMLYNVLILYFAGTIFNSFIKQKKLLIAYLVGGIIGGIFFLIFCNSKGIYSNLSIAIGASAAVLSILLAIVAYIPNLQVRVFLNSTIKLKYIAIILIFLDLLNLRNGNAGGYFAHLGGVVFGFIYGLSIRNKTANINANLFVKIKKYFLEKSEKRENKKQEKLLKKKELKKEKEKQKKQEKINLILKKISESGYSSLNDEEKDLLFSNQNKK